MKKETWIAALVCTNAALLAGIVLQTMPQRTALAQGAGLGANYMAVAGEVQDQYDALYVVDMKNHILHAFQFDRGQRMNTYVDSRSLKRDFRNDGR
jgi:hypothetical protein